jgi:dCTP deaminase
LLKFIEQKFNEFLFKNTSASLFDSSELQGYKTILSSHIEEYICDHIGRILLGQAFDFALLKLFCNSEHETTDISETHPPVTNRINYSLQNLVKLKIGNTDLKVCLDYMTANFRESKRNEHSYIILAEDIATNFIKEFIKTNPVFDEAYLSNSWNIVTPELNAFRPPFETVSVNEPILITPSQSLVCGTIYFYGKHYKKSNEFFLQSTLDEDDKYGILRKRIIEHIRYSISNYDFIKKARQNLNFSDIKAELDSTIWSLREKKISGKSSPHVVIVPTIDPSVQYSSNSVDLRLGTTFLVNSLSKYTHINPDKSAKNEDTPIEAYYDDYFIEIGDEFTLHPHQFILAQTLEYVCIPPDYYALVLGRSTWGRLGLNIATATSVGSGFRGCITLELRNLGETPLKLKVGVRICQICLIPIPINNSPAGYFANPSKYIGPISPEVPKIRMDKDWDLLRTV